ncbi:MAG: 23S rRNA (guanosine(2251)-2'-O)-methyltransferase RlmB [Eubacteriales bacterium]
MDSDDIIYGRNTVREAVKSGRSIDKVIIAEGTTDGSIKEIEGLARDRKIVVIKKDKRYLDEICMPFGRNNITANHQGVAAFVSALEYAEVEDIISAAQDKDSSLIILLDGVTDINNVGAIIRSAECLGADGIIMAKRRSAPLNSAANKASCGALEYVKVARVSNISQALDKLKQAGYWTAAAVMDGQDVLKTDLSGKIALVIGDEGEGISPLVSKNCDYKVSIELMGKIESLNASAAAAVLMFEKRRQDKTKNLT